MSALYLSVLDTRSRTLKLVSAVASLGGVQEAVNAAELKRIIEGLPLETSAVAPVEWRLGQLEPSQFAALLTELARDNHAFRCGTESLHLMSWLHLAEPTLTC